MRIYIRQASGKHFFIPVPLSLAQFALRTGNFGMRIAKKYVDKDNLKYLECVDLKVLSKSLNLLREYKGMSIVEVKSSNGDEVVIRV